MTESAFLRQVLEFAKLNGWRVVHFRPARTLTGWRTAVQGDGAGFPDLLMVRAGRIIAAELKVGRNKATPEQVCWLACFREAHAEAYLWRPEDWQEIVQVLQRDNVMFQVHDRTGVATRQRHVPSARMMKQKGRHPSPQR